MQCDFYSYSIERNLWTLLSSDTAIDGGPRLLYDHQVRGGGPSREVVDHQVRGGGGPSGEVGGPRLLYDHQVKGGTIR